MNLSDATLRAAVAKLLFEELTAADKETRAQGLALFLEANEEMGVKSAEVRLPSGEHIANATLPQPKPRIEFDDAEFLALVERENPDEIVRSVNPAYQAAIKRHLKIDGDEVVDTRSGEVVAWATVRKAGRPKSFTITFTDEGREAVKQAWRDDPTSVLEFLSPPELLPADDPEQDDLDLAEFLEMRARQSAGGGAE